jgi:hypothetical protein
MQQTHHRPALPASSLKLANHVKKKRYYSGTKENSKDNCYYE